MDRRGHRSLQKGTTVSITEAVVLLFNFLQKPSLLYAVREAVNISNV